MATKTKKTTPQTTTAATDTGALTQKIERLQRELRQVRDELRMAGTEIRAWHKATDVLLTQVAIECGDEDGEGGYRLTIKKPDAEGLLKSWTLHARADGEEYVLSAAPIKDDKTEGE